MSHLTEIARCVRAAVARRWDPSVTSVAFVHDPSSRDFDQPSTMVRVLGDELEELRPGPIELDEIRQAFESLDYVDVADWRD